MEKSRLVWVHIYINENKSKPYILRLLSKELLRYVRLHNWHPLKLLQPVSSILQLIMLPKVFNILRMREFFLRRIIPVELLKVMNLIFVFDIPMVPRSISEIR